MKTNKIVISLAALSLGGIATATLLSCGSSSPKQTPTVLVYARTGLEGSVTDEGQKKENGKVPNPREDKKAVVYYDDDCLTYTVDDAENLKYGETDVKVHIKPKIYFHLTNDFNSQTWGEKGDMVIPYVGLGSPTNRFSYELPKEVAWTYEKETTSNEGESYLLTIDKRFFRKNIVVGYGYKKEGTPETEIDNFVTVVESNYRDNCFKMLTKEKLDEDRLDEGKNPLIIGEASEDFTDHTKNFYHQCIDTNYDYCDFSIISNGLTMSYKSDSSANDLQSFSKIVTEHYTDGVSGIEYYTNIDVYGVTASADKKHLAKKELISTYSEDKENALFRVYHTNGLTNALSVFINWNKLITTDASGDPYAQKYDYIYVQFDPMFESNVIYESENVENEMAGNYIYREETKTEQQTFYRGNTFEPRDFAVKKDNVSYSYINRWCPDTNYSGNNDETTYFASFKNKNSSTSDGWPTVSIAYTNGAGSTQVINIDKDKTYTTEDGHTIKYRTDSNDSPTWLLVSLDGYKGEHEYKDYYALYPTYKCSVSAFYAPGEWTYANEVFISINGAPHPSSIC